MVFSHEGGYVDSPEDLGSVTNLGISLRFYKKRVKPDATKEDIKNLTVNDAAEIYRRFFWDRQPFESIGSQKLCDRVFDLHVNCGQGISLLQKAFNAATGLHLLVDNMLGPKTLDAINAGATDMIYAELINQSKLYYKKIALNNPSQQIFLKGWLHRLAD